MLKSIWIFNSKMNHFLTIGKRPQGQVEKKMRDRRKGVCGTKIFRTLAGLL